MTNDKPIPEEPKSEILSDNSPLTPVIRLMMTYQENLTAEGSPRVMLGFDVLPESGAPLTYTIAVGKAIMRFNAHLNEVGAVVITPNPYPEDLLTL